MTGVCISAARAVGCFNADAVYVHVDVVVVAGLQTHLPQVLRRPVAHRTPQLPHVQVRHPQGQTAGQSRLCDMRWAMVTHRLCTCTRRSLRREYFECTCTLNCLQFFCVSLVRIETWCTWLWFSVYVNMFM